MTLNYKRGFNRIFVTLWAAWVFFVLVVWPIYWVGEARKGYHRLAATLETKADTPAQKAENEILLKKVQEEASFSYFYGDLFRNWRFALLLLVGIPALIYGLLWGVAVVVRWIARGFAT